MQSQPHQFNHQPSSGNNDDITQLEDKVIVLQNLLTVSQSCLQELRFTMTDRVSSAATRLNMLKTVGEDCLSPNEKKWLDDGLHDIDQIARILDQWGRWCEIVDPNKFKDTSAIDSMVVKISTLKK